MAKKPFELLAKSLAAAKKMAKQGVIYGPDLTAMDLRRLEQNGWLSKVIRGWYLLQQPHAVEGESSKWYSTFWDFIRVYLHHRFKNNYCLSAHSSINLHLGNTIIPNQILVMVKSGGSSIIKLPHQTSIAIYQETKTFPQIVNQIDGLNVMPLAVALHRVPLSFYRQMPQEAEIALRLVPAQTLIQVAVEGKNIAATERLIGAYQFLGEPQVAKDLEIALSAVGYQVSPINPFAEPLPLLMNTPRIKSPYAARIQILWQSMRQDILHLFSIKPAKWNSEKKYFTQLDKLYIYDAYHSLSIEGYEVSEQLINKIATGKWDPGSFQDREQINAMAAKGYYQAFEMVKLSIKKIFAQKDSIKIIKDDLYAWYAALFSPAIKAGLLSFEQLAGYRTHQVYIRNSMHTPLPCHALIDAMEAYFDCLQAEEDPTVRAVLGHFIFVYIHPYMDGNGRIARFIMNTLFAAANLPWTIIRVTHRAAYFHALEIASTKHDIKPFVKFILKEMLNKQWIK